MSEERYWITGGAGMVGSAVMRQISNLGLMVFAPTRRELDLDSRESVLAWAMEHRPTKVLHIAAKVGGIFANSTLPADFIRENLITQSNVIDAAYKSGCKNLLFVATNCTYPNNASQPIPEEALLSGPLDDTIRAYGVSKIAGIEMCRAYRRQYDVNFFSVIPPNLYGPGDNYHPSHSHIVAGILRRTHEAKVAGSEQLVIWGDGTARRELLHVDDLAAAMISLIDGTTEHDLYNIGSGGDLSVADIASAVIAAVEYNGRMVFDPSKPNGTLRKLLDSTKISQAGWKPVIPLAVGLKSAYTDFLAVFDNRSSSGKTRI